MEPKDTNASMITPEVICLYGSTKFKKEFEEANKILTLRGDIVLAPGVFMHSGDILADEQKKMLDELHLRKIDLANRVYIISNSTGYYGESTKREIEYAEKHNKKIIMLNVIINTSVVFDRVN